MQLEIAPQHHLFIIGRNGMNIKQIMQATGAMIHFPDPNNVTPQRKGTVYIAGTIDSVYLARQQLIVSISHTIFQQFSLYVTIFMGEELDDADFYLRFLPVFYHFQRNVTFLCAEIFVGVSFFVC